MARRQVRPLPSTNGCIWLRRRCRFGLNDGRLDLLNLGRGRLRFRSRGWLCLGSRLGEHTAEILSSLGFTGDEIETMRASGTV